MTCRAARRNFAFESWRCFVMVQSVPTGWYVVNREHPTRSIAVQSHRRAAREGAEPRERAPARCPSALLDSDHHGVRTHQVLDVAFPESALPHPALAVRTRVVEASVGLDQHVEAHQQPEDVPGSIVVDDRIVYDQGATLGQGVVSLPDELLLLVKVPVVQDVPHHDDVRLWKRIREEVTRRKLDSMLELLLGHVLSEDGPNLRKIESDALKMSVRERHLYGEIALRAPHVHEGLVTLPREFLCDREVRPTADSGHRLREFLEACWIGIQRFEEGLVPSLHLVLRPACPQAFGEPGPKTKETVVRHLENAADVGGLSFVQEQLRGGRVVIDAVRPLEKA